MLEIDIFPQPAMTLDAPRGPPFFPLKGEGPSAFKVDPSCSRPVDLAHHMEWTAY